MLQPLISGTAFNVLDLNFGDGPSLTIDHVTHVAFRILGNVTFLAVTCAPEDRPVENFEFNMDDIHHWFCKVQDEAYTERRAMEFAERDDAHRKAKAAHDAEITFKARVEKLNASVERAEAKVQGFTGTPVNCSPLTVMQVGVLTEALSPWHSTDVVRHVLKGAGLI